MVGMRGQRSYADEKLCGAFLFPEYRRAALEVLTPVHHVQLLMGGWVRKTPNWLQILIEQILAESLIFQFIYYLLLMNC